MNLKSLDYLFISYDEPNADENWAHLQQIVPHAKRVHGIKGYDAAHKAAAQLSTTDNFVVVDGDCKINPEFPQQNLKFNDSVNTQRDVISWPSYNPVNGLAYGNGGVKCWPKNVMLNMRSHEAASGVDFDYESYVQFDEPYGGTTIINSTPLQAWRVGFREGIKLKLLNGVYHAEEHPDHDNRQRLWNWQHLGTDVDNGIYCIAGARHSVALANSGWDYKQINDLEYLNSLFDSQDVLKYIDSTVYPSHRSIAFKNKFINPLRSKHSVLSKSSEPKYDIVFISYDEPYADENYEKLRSRFPQAKRVHGIHGIHKAHMEAASIATTSHFWVVDADAEIVPSFNFDFETYDTDNCVRVWRAINTVNDLQYGYGGVKLLPKKETLNMRMTTVDMTTSISWNYKPIHVVSNYTNFAKDPFTAWRGAFRECVKLSSSVIKNADPEVQQRLETWCTVANGPYAKYVLAGAKSGRIYGITHQNNTGFLKIINNYRFLRSQFINDFSDDTI